jgi:hypothetical protein
MGLSRNTNMSDKNVEKLKTLKNDLYNTIKNSVQDLIEDDGSIYVKLDTLEKNYDYFFTSEDYILIKKHGIEIEISDNLDREGSRQENLNMYNLIVCKEKILTEIIPKVIADYNKDNIIISQLE